MPDETAQIFQDNAQLFDSKEEYLRHLQTMIVLCVSVMQGEQGQKFTEGFMHSALKDQIASIELGKLNPKFNTH